ncbi:MAG: alginate export family protein, partial [Candidatus Binatia bacterium]
AWLLSGFYVLPTSGGFEISAGRHMGIDLGGLSLMKKDSPSFLPGLESRLFYLHYRDHRPDDGDVVAVDNRPLTARQADQRGIEVDTIGGEIVYNRALGPGSVDALAWSAGQFGEWQSLDQQSWAYAVEAGYRFTSAPWTPWIRTGIFRSSGDDDASDGDHGTFFQLLPTSRIYAFTPFYNLMNNQDVMVQLIAKPLAQLTSRLDFHYLRVTEGRDLLYFGGGATKRDFFGYGGSPAGGAHDTAYVVELTLTYALSRNVELQTYCGHAFGESVVRNGFPRDQHLTYGFVEGTLTF